MYKLISDGCTHRNKHKSHSVNILKQTLSEGTKQTDEESLCRGKLSFEHEDVLKEWKRKALKKAPAGNRSYN